jgi:hypothetical protein
MDFLEPRICRRQCDHSNDLENPLLEATSSTAEGEHKQESSKEDPSTPPHPKPLMLANFFALFIENVVAITIAIQINSQGRESFPLFHLGGVMGIVIVDVIIVDVIFVVFAIYFRSMQADVKDKAFFGISFTACIVLGLALQTLSLIVADGVKNYSWLLNHFATSHAGMIVVACFLSPFFLIRYVVLISFLGSDIWDSQTEHLHWSRFPVFLGCCAGLSLGCFTSLLLVVAN